MILKTVSLFATALGAAVLACAAPALANDGFGGLTPTGLKFGQTGDVVMEREDLFISLDRIAVDYVFRNASDKDVTGEMIFPLPPISVWGLWEGMVNLPPEPYPDNLVNFTATVDGTPVAVKIDRVAVIEAPWEEDTPVAAFYDSPGRDVTADLKRYGLPDTLDIAGAIEALSSQPPEVQKQLEAEGLAVYEDQITDSGATTRTGFPTWSIIYRYHWTQTFPAGAEVKVQHDYTHYPSGAVFGWEYPVPPEYERSEIARFCIDDGTSQAMAAALKSTDPSTGEEMTYGTAYYLEYVLRTANSWAGPIGDFRLTLDKGDAKNVISLCADGVKKTGPTTFVVEKKNFSPQTDLDILLVVANPAAD